MNFQLIHGLYYRIVPQARSAYVLDPAISPEGRFHHGNQPTLYVSPRPEWAEHAIKRYVLADDPPRVACELEIPGAKVLDLRDQEQCATWGADASLAAIPWMPERARGLAASTWRISDLARDNGADGMIYTARSEPNRWHLVLFNWHIARVTGRTLRYPHGPLE